MLAIAAVVFSVAFAWLFLWSLNKKMSTVPAEVLKLSPHRWTEQEARDAYRAVQTSPIPWRSKLPPKLDRRYIVTGGAGGVGSEVVLQLLLRGQDPRAIRILDIRKPNRTNLAGNDTSKVDFVQTDLSSESSTQQAVSKPWHPTVVDLPLTIFHIAALIDPARRMNRAYEEVKRVNVDGTIHILKSAKSAGADIFIYCSSASVGLYPIKFFKNPITSRTSGFWQLLDEDDQDRPLRPQDQFFGNYGYSKAVAERFVCDANTPTFRTGAIRPANGIYGESTNDQVVGPCLRKGTFPSWMPPIVQNFVHAGNVGLGHLLFEAALARSSDGKDLPRCAGRAYQVSDDGPPPSFADVYMALGVLTETTPISVTLVSPVAMLLLAHVVEMFDLASRLPILRWFVPRPKGDIAKLQPGLFTACAHTPAVDTAARRSVKDGGLGYVPGCNTLEGMAEQILDWNREHARAKQSSKQEQSTPEIVVENIANIGTAAAGIHG